MKCPDYSRMWPSHTNAIAVAVVLDVAIHAREGEFVPRAEIEKRFNVRRRGFENLFRLLAAHGILISHKGTYGGFQLGHDRVTIAEVISAMESARPPERYFDTALIRKVVLPALEPAEAVLYAALDISIDAMASKLKRTPASSSWSNL